MLVVGLRELPTAVASSWSKRPTAWAANVPTVFLQRLAERHFCTNVQEQAKEVLAEFDSAAAA